MGLLDGILGLVAGSVLGGGAGGQSPLGSVAGNLSGGNQAQGAALIAAAMSMLQQRGGLSGVLSTLQQSGLGNEAASWVSSGANAPVSGDQITHAFGADAIGEIAAKLGMPQGQAGSALAQVLPELVNQLTPDGRVPDNQDELLAQGLDMLKQLGGR
jgi:uncharacterized protein YidB (DUF937 family)